MDTSSSPWDTPSSDTGAGATGWADFNAFSGGETQVLNLPQTEINEEIAQTIILEPETTVQELSVSLNTLGLTPRDIISIFQALDRAGVLRGELIVM